MHTDVFDVSDFIVHVSDELRKVDALAARVWHLGMTMDSLVTEIYLAMEIERRIQQSAFTRDI